MNDASPIPGQDGGALINGLYRLVSVTTYLSDNPGPTGVYFAETFLLDGTAIEGYVNFHPGVDPGGSFAATLLVEDNNMHVDFQCGSNDDVDVEYTSSPTEFKTLVGATEYIYEPVIGGGG